MFLAQTLQTKIWKFFKWTKGAASVLLVLSLTIALCNPSMAESTSVKMFVATLNKDLVVALLRTILQGCQQKRI